MNTLTEIFENKRAEVEESKFRVPLPYLVSQCADAKPTRGFRAALKDGSKPALIAEVKRASPSAGMIRKDFDPVAIARAYERAEANALSVLTDEKYFMGSADDLRLARGATQLPVLRKDFVCDSYQLYESKAMGADAVLLIVAGLEVPLLHDLYAEAKTLGLDVLVEVHTKDELAVANALGADIIGINNRDLATFETNLATSESLIPLVHPNALRISESALESSTDVRRVLQAGAQAVLIGTAFCAFEDIEARVLEVMDW